LPHTQRWLKSELQVDEFELVVGCGHQHERVRAAPVARYLQPVRGGQGEIEGRHGRDLSFEIQHVDKVGGVSFAMRSSLDVGIPRDRPMEDRQLKRNREANVGAAEQ